MEGGGEGRGEERERKGRKENSGRDKEMGEEEGGGGDTMLTSLFRICMHKLWCFANKTRPFLIRIPDPINRTQSRHSYLIQIYF